MGDETGRHRVSASRDVFQSHQRARRSTCQRLHGETARSRVNPFLHTWIHSTDSAQRRHASSHIDPSNPSELSTHTLGEAVSFIKDCTERALNWEAAWKAYRHYKSHGQDDLLDPSTLLLFTSKLLDAIHRAKPPTNMSTEEYWKLCGLRLLTLLRELEPRISNKQDETWWNVHLTCALAYADNFDEAIRHSRQLTQYQLNKMQRTGQLKAYSVIVQAMGRHLQPGALVEYVAADWDTLSPWFLRRPLPTLMPETLPRLHAMRDSVSHIVSRIEDPASLLRVMAERSKDTLLYAAEFMIEAYCARKIASDALTVLDELKNYNIEPPVRLTLMVVDGLAKMKRFKHATNLLMTLAEEDGNLPLSRPIQVTALNLFAKWGDTSRAEEYFRRIEEHKWVSKADVATLMHCYAMDSDPTSAVELFERYFPEGSEGPFVIKPGIRGAPSPSTSPLDESIAERVTDDSSQTDAPYVSKGSMVPTIVHYTTIIRAFSRAGNQEAMNEWLQKFQATGIPPDGYLLHTILENFIRLEDVESAADVLNQMRESKIFPQPHAYTSLISLFANRRDPESAERVLKKALEDKVVPDREMLFAYMFAHVESGSWAGVIRAFDYIQSAKQAGLRMTIEPFNNLLKAYVLIGAPFRVVMEIFRRLGEVGVEPDNRTYALIIQSACDANRMEAAEHLFLTLEEQAKTFPSDLNVNIYILTIIMAAYLRQHNRDRARKVYERMVKYDVHPTSITFSLILKSYGNPRAQGDIDRAENFLSEVLAQESQSWKNILGGRAMALQNVYGPMMTAWMKKVKVTEVERLYKDMLRAGSRPTLGTLTLLLDVYRRKGMADKVREIWPQIYELAQKRGNETDALFGGDPPPEKRTRGSILCVPLSIYTDAMSADGDHHALAAAWTQIQKDGYVPDAHNWNHLCIALLRAGQVERAFALIEQIIIPIQKRSRYTEVREPPPITTPFFSDVDPRLIVPTEGALHNARRRSGRLAYHTTKSKDRLWRQQREDFAHPLHILYQLSPAWNIWRPHNIVLQYLNLVLRHLRRGGLIEPVHQPGHRGLRLSTSEDTDSDVLEMRKQEAEEMHARIKENYPLTYKAAEDFYMVQSTLQTRRQAARQARDEEKHSTEDGVETEEGGDVLESDAEDTIRLREQRRSRYGLQEQKKYSRST